MSIDPLGDAIGRTEPAQPGTPGAGPAPSQPPASESAPAEAGTAPGPAATGYEPQQAQGDWPGPEVERPLLERRPEILLGAALAGGFVAAQLLGRVRGR